MDKKHLRPADRMRHVSYPIRDIIMEAKKLEASGTKMIYLNIGDPAVYGFSPPEKFTGAVKQALDEKYTGYAPSPGDPELRDVAARLDGCAPGDVFITQGLTEGIDFFFHSLLDPGDKLLLPNPNYPLYITKVATYGVNAVMYEHDANGEIDIADLEKKISGAKAMVIINPNNPTGAVYAESNLRKAVELCAAHGVPIFYDGSYDRIIFREYVDFRKIAKGKVPFVYGSSVSKNFLYPGARVGWVAFHGGEWGDVKEAFFRMCNQRLSTNWEFQRGAAAIIGDYSHVKKFNADLLERRDAMLRATSSLPLAYPKPMGAFYAFMQVDSPKWKGKTDWDFARAALKEGIVFVPGSGFGKQEEKVHFRTIFLPSAEIMELAFRKIEKLF